MEDLSLPREIIWKIMDFLPNQNEDNYNKCVRVLQKRFNILDNVIRFGIKNNLPIANRLLDDKFDKLISGSFYLLRY